MYQIVKFLRALHHAKIFKKSLIASIDRKISSGIWRKFTSGG
eukprot:UN16244